MRQKSLSAAALLIALAAPSEAQAQVLPSPPGGTPAFENYLRMANGPKGLSPEEYLQLLARAGRAYEAKDYATSANLHRQLVNVYPNDGDTWYLLGHSLFETKSFAEAARAFEKVDQLGVRGYLSGGPAGISAYAAPFPRMAALSYARVGQMDRAMDWLDKAINQYHLEAPQRLLDDEAFAPLKQTPRFRALAGHPYVVTTDRTEGWRGDVDFLLNLIQLYNPVYSAGRPLPEDIRSAALELKQRIPKLTDAQVAVELQHILALLRHGHNTLYFPYVQLPGDRASFSRLPIDMHLFPDGLYVVDAKPGYTNLIGSKVLRFDDTPVGRAVLATTYLDDRENEMEILQSSTIFLAIPEILHALGVTRKADAVSLTLLDRSQRKITVRPKLLPNEGLQRRMTAPILPGIGSAPLYLSRPAERFWYEPLREDPRTLYVQFNEVGPQEPLRRFGLELRSYLQKNQINNVIVDVRRNNGGNTYWYRDLLRTLIGFDQTPGKQLFVLTARKTYSAAANFIAELDRLTDATFVGEPSGGKPLMVGGDQTDFRLPYSGLRGAVSGVTWQLSGPRDTRVWIAPELPVALQAQDYFTNRDPVLEAVLSVIKGADSSGRSAEQLGRQNRAQAAEATSTRDP